MEHKDVQASSQEYEPAGPAVASSTQVSGEQDGLLNEEDPSLLARAQLVPGKLPGHERIRIVRPSHSSLRRVGDGVLEATEASLAPRSGREQVTYRVKRFLIGSPLTNAQAAHERLTKFKALAVLSSDAISSVAYATEASMVALLAAGAMATGIVFPISIAIVLLLAIVAISYRQTIPAYPGGGGSYIVAKDNLGTLPGLVAAASLLIDYILTVSVSVSSGVQNLASVFQGLGPYVVAIDVALVILITIVNLRGIRESGSVFAIPTYFFIASAVIMIVGGLFKAYLIDHQPFMAAFHPPTGITGTEPVSIFLILKAFASGCSAMTGVEAISNGVPAFKKPETKNAAITLTWMASILAILFIGITLLAMAYGVTPQVGGNPTVIAQIAQKVFQGPFAFFFPIFQLSVLFILVLAANTSYADFPRLASLLARDHFLPHQFAFRGDRLAFSTGIVVLAIFASALLIIFKGSTDALIGLYAVGVFMSFTLSQSGMVIHWWRLRSTERGWQRKISINALGACTTLVVAIVIAWTKFLEGAWVVVILIPILVLMFMSIHKHYHGVERQRTTTVPGRAAEIKHLFIVPIAAMDRVSVQSIAYARSITKNVVAVHVSIDEGDTDKVRATWQDWAKRLPSDDKTMLVVIESPYRSLYRPILDYIDSVKELYPEFTITVLLPEFVVAHWWEHFLHNQTALRLKAALLFRPGIVVTSMPQHLPSRIPDMAEIAELSGR
ncbi:APC family permease [Ktedonobacter robiniae]|uniref:Amino acid permease n=1 Tax=Ktedonobacter robiniae TaxID=2778365 RepID=A0ABQ3V5B3_9CHLR|nr:APC family permease [Ktedonobacter robiniae]GHO60203.1 amino acid permease [Ktedonobacter robiniae]